MDDKDQRIKQLESECQSLLESINAFRMTAMCFNQDIAETSQAQTLKERLRHAKSVLGDAEPER